MHFRLIGVGNDFRFELIGAGPHIVGRAVTNDCAVVDPTVSRKHAELRLRESGVDITDAGSSNGTFVNGVQITTAHAAPGAEITFGKVVFRLEQVAAPKPVPAPAPAGRPAEQTHLR